VADSGEGGEMEKRASSYLTREQFFDLVRGRGGRWELVDGEAVMMAGANQRHQTIAANIFLSLGGQLRGKGCRPTASDTAVATSAENVRYPDVVVDCGPREDTSMYATTPTMVIEVLSPTTRHFDSHKKLGEYLDHPDIMCVLLVDPDGACAILHRRDQDGWVRTLFEDLDDVIDLPEIGAYLSLRDVYEGLELRPRPQLVRQDVCPKCGMIPCACDDSSGYTDGP